MGWENRGNNGPYYYRKRRIGDRVVSEYVGSGVLAEATAILDALARQERESERLAWQSEREEVLEGDRMVDEVGDMVRTLVRAWYIAQGYHTHKGQWRRKSEQ